VREILVPVLVGLASLDQVGQFGRDHATCVGIVLLGHLCLVTFPEEVACVQFRCGRGKGLVGVIFFAGFDDFFFVLFEEERL